MFMSVLGPDGRTACRLGSTRLCADDDSPTCSPTSSIELLPV
jgi:hypothetical protein